MVKIKLKQNDFLSETRNRIRGSVSALKRYLFDIVIGNNEDHEQPAEKRNQYNFDFEFVKQNGDEFSIPVTFNVVIGASLKPQKGIEYDDDTDSDEILEEPRTSGAYYPGQEKVIINLELPEIFLKTKNLKQQEQFREKISFALSRTVGHELYHDLNNKVGINRLINKRNNAKAIAAKKGREEPTEKDKQKAGYQILQPKHRSIFDEGELKEFDYLNGLDELTTFSYNIYQTSMIEKISLLDSFKRFFNRGNFKSFEYAPYLDSLTKVNYLKYFKLKYPEVYEKNYKQMAPFISQIKKKYDQEKKKHDNYSGILDESKKLSRYWDERSKARAKRAKRSRNKIDREWASGQQEKSKKIDNTFMSLYEKELEMTEELTSDIEETIKKYEEQKFVIPNKKNLKLRVKPGKNPYLDPKYRKTKFKSRMDYLSKKGVAAHVGDIAPMSENINIPKEEKGDGSK